MPALMCGADNNYLALTRRQIDTIRKAGEETLFTPDPASPPPTTPTLAAAAPPPTRLTPRNRRPKSTTRRRATRSARSPVAAVANCCPGLEVDFRAVWRRMFKGLLLREYDSLVVDVEPDAEPEIKRLKGHRTSPRVFLPGDPEVIPVVTQFEGPASSDPDGKIVLTTNLNPAGLAPLEWSNALAPVLAEHRAAACAANSPATRCGTSRT